MKPAKLRDNLAKNAGFEIPSSLPAHSRHALPPLAAELADSHTIHAIVEENGKGWSSDSNRLPQGAKIESNRLTEDSNAFPSTVTPTGLENKDMGNKDTVGGIGITSAEKKKPKRHKSIPKDPLNDVLPSMASIHISGETAADSIAGDQRRVQRLMSSSPARQLASLSMANSDVNEAFALDPLLRTPSAKRIDLVSLEEDAKGTTDPKMSSLKPQRSASIETLNIDGIANARSRNRTGAAASLSSLDSYQQHHIPPPLVASEAFKTVTAPTSSSSLSPFPVSSSSAAINASGQVYADSTCTNIEEIIEADKAKASRQQETPDSDLAFNMVVKDETKALANDRILQLRIQEAKAMSRSSIDNDNGAIMHSFSLWSKVNPAANKMGFGSFASRGSTNAQQQSIQHQQDSNLIDESHPVSSSVEATVSQNGLVGSGVGGGGFAPAGLGAPAIPTAIASELVVASIGSTDRPRGGGGVGGLSGSGRLRGPKALRAQVSEVLLDGEKGQGAVQGVSQGEIVSEFPAPLPNIFDSIVRNVTPIKSLNVESQLNSRSNNSNSSSSNRFQNENLIDYFDKMDVGSSATKLEHTQQTSRSVLGDTTPDIHAGLARSLRSKVVKASQSATADGSGSNSPSPKPSNTGKKSLQGQGQSSLLKQQRQQQQQARNVNHPRHSSLLQSSSASVTGDGTSASCLLLLRREKSESSIDPEKDRYEESDHSVEEDIREEEEDDGYSYRFNDEDDTASVQSIEDDEDFRKEEPSLSGSSSLMMATFPMHPAVQRTRNPSVEKADAIDEGMVNSHHNTDSNTADWIAAEKLPPTNALVDSPPKPPVDETPKSSSKSNRKTSSLLASSPYVHQAAPSANQHRVVARKSSTSNTTSNNINASTANQVSTPKSKHHASRDDGSGQIAKTSSKQRGHSLLLATKGSASTSKKEKIRAFNKGSSSEDIIFPDERLISVSSTAPSLSQTSSSTAAIALVDNVSSPVLSEVSDLEESTSDKQRTIRVSSKKGGASSADMMSSANHNNSDWDRAQRQQQQQQQQQQQSDEISNSINSAISRGISPYEAAQVGRGYAQIDIIGDAAAISSNGITTIEPIKWKRGEVIGEGAFGKVFKGLNEKTGELLAVKQLFINDGSDKDVNTLKREIRLICDLHHENIVRYLGTTQSDRYLFILLEYVPGGSVARMLEQFGAFSEELIKRFCCQIMSGMEYLHDKDIIHRDIKGANVLVTDSGIAKLSDFGCSRQLVGCCTASLEESLRAIRGSVPWMAPEVIKQSGQTGKPSDIWSVGAFVIEMATGKPPYSEFKDNLAALFHVATSQNPPPVPTHLSQPCASFIGRCCVINPEQRASASQLRHDPFIAQDVKNTKAALSSSSSSSSGGNGRSNNVNNGVIPPTSTTNSPLVRSSRKTASAATASNSTSATVSSSLAAATSTIDRKPSGGSQVRGKIASIPSISKDCVE